MSLLDALLLDPAPFNIWIAKRTDGIKGTGTASDPYDGSTARSLGRLKARDVTAWGEAPGKLPHTKHLRPEGAGQQA